MEKKAKMPTHQLTIPNTVFIDDNIHGNEKLLLSEIIWMQDYNEKHNGVKYCQASNFYFRMILGLKSERAITDLIAKLKDMGYIKELPYCKGNFRRLVYNFEKCFWRDVVIGHTKPRENNNF